MVDLATSVWRDYVTDGVPLSGANKPNKAKIRQWGAYLEALHLGAGISYAFSTTTADADPGAGIFRLNNAAVASATAAYIDNVDSTGVTVSSILDTWDDSTNTVRGTLTLRGVDNTAVVHVFNVTGSVVDGTGYRKLTVAYIGGSGTLVNGDNYALVFLRAGDRANAALPGYNTDDYAGGSESARLAALIASTPTQPYAYRADSHFGIIRDTSPLNYQGTRASFVLQHRDTASGAASALIPGAVFSFNSTGDGSVNSGAESSTSIWRGLTAAHTKSGDGSAHAFTAAGQLGAYGAGTYNELGGFVGELTNIGSLHGTMSGVEMLLKDSPDVGVTDYDTNMNAIIGRIARFNAGSKKSRNFYATSEGDTAVDMILGVSTGGLKTWTDGINLVGGIFNGNPIVIPNNTSIAARNAANSAAVPLIKADTSDNTLVLAGGGATKSITFVNSAVAIQFNIAGTASAANYPEVSGATAGNAPLYWTRGSDTDIGAGFATKGTGVHSFYTGGGNFYKQVEIANVTTSANYLQFKGAIATASPTVSSLGSDTNIDLTLTPKGTGAVRTAAAVLSSGAGGVGYSTGAGGTVTQATSRTTGVTLNKVSGAITMFTAAGSATPATFTVTNSAVAATDTISLNIKSGATNTYFYFVTTVAAGSFNVTFWTTGGTASDTPVINFNVIKGVAA